MGVNSLPKTVTRQRRGCDLNQGPTAPESSTLTTRLPSHLKTVPVNRGLDRGVSLEEESVCTVKMCKRWVLRVQRLQIAVAEWLARLTAV